MTTPEPAAGSTPTPQPPAGARPAVFDPGLQPERTALAWRRTGLVLVAGSLAALRFLPGILGVWTVLPVVLGMVAAVAVLVFAHRRHVAVHTRLVASDGDRVPLPSGRLLAVVAAAVVGYGITALVAVLLLDRV